MKAADAKEKPFRAFVDGWITMKPAAIRAVVFDAVGTLILPDPPAAEVYADVGRRFGSRLTVEDIRLRFVNAFNRQESIDQQSGWRTSEERECERWRAIVCEVLDDVADPDRCFQDLFEHFSLPGAWRCDSDGAAAIRELTKCRLALGLASNYDRRLRKVVSGLPELDAIEQVFISSEMGWRKPAREFFSTVALRLGLTANEVLFVGDDPVNDYAGATAAGFHAVLLDPQNHASDGFRSISELTALTKLIR